MQLICGTTKPSVDVEITWSWLATLFGDSKGPTRLPEICLTQICTVKKLCLWGSLDDRNTVDARVTLNSAILALYAKLPTASRYSSHPAAVAFI